MSDSAKHRMLGVFLGFVGGLAVGASHYAVSVLVERHSPYVVMWHMSIPLFVFSLCMAFVPNIYETVTVREFPTMILRNAVALIGTLTNAIAVSYIPVYEADMARCTETIFITAMGFCILKQRPHTSVIVALFFSIIGMLMIYRPDWLTSNHEHIFEEVSSTQRLIGIAIGLLSAFMIALHKILSKKIPNMDYRVITLYECWLYLIIMTIIVVILQTIYLPKTLVDWLLPVCIGFTYVISILCYAAGFKMAPAAYVGFASMSFLPMTILLKSTIEGKPPNIYDYIGMVCILISVLISMFSVQISSFTLFIKQRVFGLMQNNCHLDDV